MRVRVISASVGIPAVLLAIWLGLPGVGVLAVGAGAIGGTELYRMMRPDATLAGSVRVVSLVMGPALVAILASYLLDDGISGDLRPIMMAIIFTLALLLRGMATLGRSRSNPTKNWVYWIFAAYAGLALAHAPLLVDLNDGKELILLAILTTFAIDSVALFVGVSIGRHRLAPNISPKKSWEGAIGGVVGGIAAAILIDAAFDIRFEVIAAGILGGVLGVSGVIGDLYESWIKRRAGIKDSGTLIPGHGGILDRLDSVLPNVMIVYWAAVWSAT